MGFFAFRLNKIRVKSNRDWNASDMHIYSIVAGDGVNVPNLDAVMHADDLTAKKEAFKAASIGALNAIQFTKVEHVHDNSDLTFGDTGFTLYRSDSIPIAFDWQLLVIDDDSEVRDFWSNVEAIVDDPKFDDFSTNVLIVASASLNPTAVAAAAIAKYVVSNTARVLKENDNDQVGLIQQSFNKYMDYPHGTRESMTRGMTGNIKAEYTIFGLD